MENSDPDDNKRLFPVIEALLFSSGDRIPLSRLSGALGIEPAECRVLMEDLAKKFEEEKRGVRIRQIDNGYQMYSAPEYYGYIEKLHAIKKKQGLSKALTEVLAIIAYKQPVTRVQIERIRGISSDNAICRLVEKGLIRVSGRLDAPGRPLLYQTTENFLRSYGFSSLKDLPVIDIIDT